MRVNRSPQRGVASLAMVMVLFFIIAMVAAYTSRNMIFEQRTSVNQLRSTQAQEAAQAGLEWALAQLNSGRIDAACLPSTNTANTSFRDRYLSIDVNNAVVTARLQANNSALAPSCVANGSGAWSCSCPSDGNPSLTTPTASDLRSAFRVRFINMTSRPRTVKIDVIGCTRLSEQCLSAVDSDASGTLDGRARVQAMFSMKSGLPTAPSAAITARGNVSGDVLAYNTDVTVSGVTIQAGGLVTVADNKLYSVPGTPSASSKVADEVAFSDAQLAGTPKVIGERMFAAHFGLWPSTYREQPATVVIDCVLGCNDSVLRATVSANPGRMIWVDGNMSIDTAADIGSATAPVMMVVAGNLSFTAAATLYGVVYGGRNSLVTPPAFALTGPGRIRGALIAEHAVSGVGDPAVVYNADVIKRIRQTTGSYVVVPGSWKDF